jgi:hypothetical protein
MKKIAIIGSGIAGLYSAFLLKKNNHVTIFEKNKTIGGRIKNFMFENKNVVAGAGIGRASDKLLYKLCENLKLKPSNFQSQSVYSRDIDPEFTPLAKVNELKKIKLSKEDRGRLTFQDFATKHLGKKDYDKFVLYVGETDYEKADVIDVLNDYGFEKSFSSGFPAFSISWDAFLDAFRKLFKEQIVLGVEIDQIRQTETGKFIIEGEEYDQVIVATTIAPVRRLLKNLSIPFISDYENISCQTFARVYAKLNQPLDLSGNRAMITGKPFQKIIEMNRVEGSYIYMISYSDNESADFWQKNKENMKTIIEKNLNNIFTFPKQLIVENTELVYWECGTHFFKPLNPKYENRDDFLKKVQNPLENLFVVGEAFSKNQGWCEGALESVEAIKNKLLINNNNKKRSSDGKRQTKPIILKRSKRISRKNPRRSPRIQETNTKIILRKSARPDKKFTAVVGGTSVHFGAAGYSDYTKNKDDKRKQRYINRHQKRENWTKSGVKSAGFWSRWVLWNKPNLEQSIKDTEQKFGIHIDYK